MQRRVMVALIALGMTAAACSGPRENEFGKDDSDKIKQLTQDMQAAFNAKDMPRLISHYAGQAVFMPPNTGTLRGKESIEGFLKELLASGATDLGITTVDVGGHGTIAYESGTYTMKTRPPDGKPETRDRGKFLFVLREAGGRWRFEYTIWSSDLPVAAAAPPK